ncbi:putative restriction endonuclease [Catenuloplanes nepalensis]|uniref:Restriction endonuclease n=1 Tax=Catenuloplanes nepalensis TaxID=587533 RepID=A0ABT9N189_9ACTN|nr:YDG/SRA domain-containing protein [Catenuloplanes nepalensis]MDP9797472.1 putative restriction endonuclease [Catenuloplanes nepalensis]
MRARTYGEIQGFPPGSTFVNRRDLADSGVHRPLQGGICGGKDGAESIVVSGGYVDDEDYWNEIIYTGQGGRKEGDSKHTSHQTLTLGNAGLARNHAEGYPVRVVRGSGGDPRYSPASGLRYDGLFRVVDVWHDEGRDGFQVWRFRLVAGDGAGRLDVVGDIGSVGPAERTEVTLQRLVRNTRVARRVKELHDYTCQVCGLQIRTPGGLYAEAAHVQGLGRPHNGPDTEGNVLCLCPNHHVMFDSGAIYVDDDWLVRNSEDRTVIGPLQRTGEHRMDLGWLVYHRQHYGLG